MSGLIGNISGAGGEHIAEEHLIALGAQILCRNFKAAGAEIDLIAKLDGRIVFVEVKARFGAKHGTAGEAITPAKAAKIRRAAQVYLKKNGGIAQPMRFDAVLVSERGIKHIPSAF